MPKTTSYSIFNYDFEGFYANSHAKNNKTKDSCCEKFKKKKEKHCKNCPNQLKL